MVIETFVLALLILTSNISLKGIKGNHFVAATIPGACSNSDDGAYWDSRGYSTSPCCGISCGCTPSCSKCCPASQDAGTITYYCDATDISQCLYCATCAGGSSPRCSFRETNECESDCGSNAQCDDKASSSYTCTNNIDIGGYCDANCQYTAADNNCEASCAGYTGVTECDEKPSGGDIPYCNKGGSSYIADECSATCVGQDRIGENICRSANSLGSGDGCTAHPDCNGKTPSACSGTIYCSATCQRGADTDNDGKDDYCDSENTLADCDDNLDNDGDNTCDFDGCGSMPADLGCSGVCTFCGMCGEGVINLCDRTECEQFCGSCYFISGMIEGTCYSCSGASCPSYDGDQQTCTIDPCHFNNCAWTGSSCCGKTNGGVEICDNIDNDCDGSVDEGVTIACQDYTQGVCATSTQVCTKGEWGTCQAKTNEVCNDNLDNDCDGTTDCLDPECYGKIDGNGHTCCRDALGFKDAACPADSACVYDGCVDDNTKNGYYYDYFCGASGFCIHNTASCDFDCANNGCCYPESGVAVCANEKAFIDIDGLGEGEKCCAGDWKGADCLGLTCTSTDTTDHDCCGVSDCTGMFTGDCGSVACESNNYACTVDKNTGLCTGKTSGVCGVASGTCSAQSQGWYNSYTCNYASDSSKCGNDEYCGGTFSCANACTTLCIAGCEFCYSICSGFVNDGDPITMPANIASCVSHGCWSECVT